MEWKSALHFPCPSPLQSAIFFLSFLSGQFEILRNNWCNHHHPMPDRTPRFSQKVERAGKKQQWWRRRGTPQASEHDERKGSRTAWKTRGARKKKAFQAKQSERLARNHGKRQQILLCMSMSMSDHCLLSLTACVKKR